MTNPKGKARERAVKEAARDRGMPARYSEHNSKGRDVDVESGVLVAVEVKDRLALNVHKALKKTQATWPDLMPALVWHRVSRKEGNVNSTPDGPTLLHFTLDDGLDLLAVLRQAKALCDVSEHGPGNPPDLRSVSSAREALGEAVERITDRYPGEAL